MILFKKADNKKRTILENYTPSVDNPATLIADFYALDYMINGFRSYNSEEDEWSESFSGAMFNALDPRGFSSDDPEYKEEYVEKGRPNVPPGYLGSDLKLIAKKRQEALEKVSYVLQATLGNAIIGEGKYVFSGRGSHEGSSTSGFFAVFSDPKEEAFVADELYGVSEEKMKNAWLEEKYKAWEDFKANYPKYMNLLYEYIVDKFYKDNEEEVDYKDIQTPPMPRLFSKEPFKTNNLHDVIELHGEQWARDQFGDELVDEYLKALEAAENAMQPDVPNTQLDLFTGTEYAGIELYRLSGQDLYNSVQYVNSTLSPNTFNYSYNIKFLNNSVEIISGEVYNNFQDGVLPEISADVEEAWNDYYGKTVPLNLKGVKEEGYSYSDYRHHNYFDLLDEYDSVTEAADKALPALKVAFGNSTSELRTKIKPYLQDFMKQNPHATESDIKYFIQSMKTELNSVSWTTSFGGEKWRNIADAYGVIRENPDSVSSVDFAIDVVHNCGSPFDKVGFNAKRLDLDNILDTKTFMGGKYHSRENRKDYGKVDERYKEGQPVTPTDLEVYLSEDLRQVYHDFSVYEESGGLSKPSDSVRQFMSEPDPTWYGKPKRSGLTFEEWKKKRGLWLNNSYVYNVTNKLSMW